MTCGQCEYWIKPEAEYEPNSLSLCKYLEDWLDKFPSRNPPVDKYNSSFAALGGKIWMRDIERNCKKFESKYVD